MRTAPTQNARLKIGLLTVVILQYPKVQGKESLLPAGFTLFSALAQLKFRKRTRGKATISVVESQEATRCKRQTHHDPPTPHHALVAEFAARIPDQMPDPVETVEREGEGERELDDACTEFSQRNIFPFIFLHCIPR